MCGGRVFDFELKSIPQFREAFVGMLAHGFAPLFAVGPHRQATVPGAGRLARAVPALDADASLAQSTKREDPSHSEASSQGRTSRIKSWSNLILKL